jgi:hypothetical protein
MLTFRQNGRLTFRPQDGRWLGFRWFPEPLRWDDFGVGLLAAPALFGVI